MTSVNKPIFTIGHSTHSIEAFVALLQKHGVTALADVRSAPYSRFNPQFNRDTLQTSLAQRGIKYVFLGRELGGRSDDPSCFENGQIVYTRVAQTSLFQEGIERVIRGAGEYNIALMCAEKEPLECHRTLLVGRVLADRGVSIQHILADGTLEAHAAAMDRLLDLVGLPQQELFRSRDELVAEALERQERRVAYRADKWPTPARRTIAMRVLTIGFTKKPAQRFFELLRESGAKRVVDVRLNNVSQLAGFAKKNDLAYFLKEICGMDYVHLPELAPTQELLDAYKKRGGSWKEYEVDFLDLMKQRRIEASLSRDVIADGCLLCSEDKPHHCHRRLVAEYLKEHWGDVEIIHLG